MADFRLTVMDCLSLMDGHEPPRGKAEALRLWTRTERQQFRAYLDVFEQRLITHLGADATDCIMLFHSLPDLWSIALWDLARLNGVSRFDDDDIPPLDGAADGAGDPYPAGGIIERY